jgi:hypothetical protein
MSIGSVRKGTAMWKAVKRSWTAVAEPAEAENPAEEPCG